MNEPTSKRIERKNVKEHQPKSVSQQKKIFAVFNVSLHIVGIEWENESDRATEKETKEKCGWSFK